MNLTAIEAIAEMWSLADKPERLRCFHKIIQELDTSDLTAEKFWSNFWSIWQSSENLFADGDIFHDLLAFGRKLGPPIVGLDDEEREALEALPDEVEVYRGSCPHNQLGWSWTTDLEKARWFAGRSVGDTTRYVSVTRVSKANIIGYLLGRGESEVVIDPDVIDGDIATLEEFESEVTGGQSLFHLIQTGGMLDSPEMDEMRARMMMATVKPERIEATRATMSRATEFCEWAGLSRGGYFKACVAMLDKLEAGEVLFPQTPSEAITFQM